MQSSARASGRLCPISALKECSFLRENLGGSKSKLGLDALRTQLLEDYERIEREVLCLFKELHALSRKP